MRYVDGDLELIFGDGGIQHFADVSQDLAQGLYQSPGKYGYFLTHIKPTHERTVLRKARHQRGETREIVWVRTHWLEGTSEVERYDVPRD